MALFRYKVLDAQGMVDTEVADLPFEDVSPAIRYLERQGGVVLTIQRLGALSSQLTRLATYGVTGVSRMDLAEFLNNMAILVRSGVSVLQALDEIIEDTGNKMLKMTLKFIRSDIQSGQTLASALDRHPKVFPPLVRNLARIGEETGNLDDMLEKGSRHLRNIAEILRATKSALIYPAFLLVFISGAVIVWFYFVIPKLLEFFQQMEVDMPPISHALLAIGNWMQHYLGITLIGLILATVLIIFLRKTVFSVRYYTDLIALKIPILKRILITSNQARICEYLGILLSAGVGVIPTFVLIRDSIGNTVYKRKLAIAEEGVRGGNFISDSLRQAQALHPFAIRMISVGETTGRLDDQTEYVAGVYRAQLNDLVQNLNKVLEPLLIGIAGVIFGIIIVGLFLPIYDIIGKLGQQI